MRCSRQDAPLCERCSHFGLNCEFSPTKAMGRPRRRRSAQFSDVVPRSFMGIDALPEELQLPFADFSEDLLSFDPGLLPAQSGLSWNEPSRLPQESATQVGTLGSQPQYQPRTLLFPQSQDGSELPTQSDGASERRPRKCPCVVMVNQHFSMVDDSPESFRTIQLLQESTRSAEKILHCSVCFDPGNGKLGLSKNVHLLGSLMSSIAALFGGFLLYQKRRAAECSVKNEPMRFVLGEASNEHSLVNIALNGQDYWSFLKATLTSEFARLVELHNAFAERQTQLHSQGHEACEKGCACTRIEVSSLASEPSGVCPSKVDITSHFSCFRTVEQVRTAIEETQRILES